MQISIFTEIASWLRH